MNSKKKDEKVKEKKNPGKQKSKNESRESDESKKALNNPTGEDEGLSGYRGNDPLAESESILEYPESSSEI